MIAGHTADSPRRQPAARLAPVLPSLFSPKGLWNLAILMRTSGHLRPISRTFRPPEGGGAQDPAMAGKLPIAALNPGRLVSLG